MVTELPGAATNWKELAVAARHTPDFPFIKAFREHVTLDFKDHNGFSFVMARTTMVLEEAFGALVTRLSD